MYYHYSLESKEAKNLKQQRLNLWTVDNVRWHDREVHPLGVHRFIYFYFIIIFF